MLKAIMDGEFDHIPPDDWQALMKEWATAKGGSLSG